MCEGEFESMKAIRETCPEFCPEPYAWGRYARQDPETHFLLGEFREIGNQVRDATEAALLRHADSLRSPPSL